MKTIYLGCYALTIIEKKIIKENMLKVHEILSRSLEPGKLFGVMIEENGTTLK